MYAVRLHHAGGPFRMSGGRVSTDQDATVVRVETGDGLVGWGEQCVFTPSFLPGYGPTTRAALGLLAPAVLGADPFHGGDRVVKALRARLGQRVTILAGFYFAIVPEVLEVVGPAARGLYVTTSDLSRAELELSRAAERFVEEFGDADAGFVLEAAQAADLVFRAIARSDGTRASVLDELKAARVKNGLLGTFRFDRNGDITPATVPILRITGSTPPSAGLPSNFQGAVLDRVVGVPRSLVP